MSCSEASSVESLDGREATGREVLERIYSEDSLAGVHYLSE